MQKSLQVVQAIVMLCIVPFDPKAIPEKKERSFAEKFCGEKFWWVGKVERMSGNLLRDRSVRPSLLLTELSAQWPELEGSIIAQ